MFLRLVRQVSVDCGMLMTGLHVSARTNVSMAPIPMVWAMITGTKSVVKRREAWRNRLLWLAKVVDSRMFQPICPGFETRFSMPCPG